MANIQKSAQSNVTWAFAKPSEAVEDILWKIHKNLNKNS